MTINENIQFDLLIRNAKIIDGNNSKMFISDVAIKYDRIKKIAPKILEQASKVIDASGLTLTPGFIDVHSHDDFALLSEPLMTFKIQQGITTCIIGNCGFSSAPFDTAIRFGRMMTPSFKGFSWKDYETYFKLLNENPASVNVATLIGHNTILEHFVGNIRIKPTVKQLLAMQNFIVNSLEQGAIGFSTGLIYSPGVNSSTNDIIKLVSKLTNVNAIYATHMRNEADYLCQAIEETIKIGKENGVRVQISHHKAAGKNNWGKVKQSLKLIEDAQRLGLDITADQYPYTAGSTILSELYNFQTFDINNTKSPLGYTSPENVIISSAIKSPEIEKKSIADLTKLWDLSLEQTLQKIVSNGDACVIVKAMSEDDVKSVMRHSSTMFGSDGGPTEGDSIHPRLYGTFPKILGQYVREEKVLSLEEAIHKMTLKPAKKFNLTDRGIIKENAIADLVLFDANLIIDTATYENPCQYPQGISHVIVNGRLTVENSQHLGTRNGKVLLSNF